MKNKKLRKKRIKRVVMVIGRFYPDMGGMERQARKLATFLIKSGTRVDVLTRNYHKGPWYEQLEEICIYRSPIFGNLRTLNSFSYILFCLFFLIKNRKTIDLIHCHQSYSPATIGSIAKSFLNKPVFVKITASGEYGEVNALKKLPFLFIRKILFRNINRFFVVNPWITKELGTLGVSPEQTLWIPNGVEVPRERAFQNEFRRRLRATYNIKDDCKILVFSGRFSEEKNLFSLIENWEMVTKEVSDAKLFMIGVGGDYRNVESEIRKMVDDKNLGNSVIFTGKVENVNSYLLAADCFVLPSKSEGMSNSLLEAMAVGLPCVVSNIPANITLIEHEKNGLLVPLTDQIMFFHHIVRVFSDEKLKFELGKNARTKIEETFAMGKVCQMVQDVYQNYRINE